MTNAQDFAAGEIPQAAQRMWTSTLRLQDKELCSILNYAVRKDDPEIVEPLSILARAINMLCVTVGSASPAPAVHPPDNICYRGGGFDDQHRAFFNEGKVFRQPAFLATSFERGVAERFVQRSSMPSRILWKILIDPHNKCRHVNLVRKTNVAGEEEYLFAPFSVFTVLRATWTSGTANNPHLVELQSAVDNQAECEHLPLAPWS